MAPFIHPRIQREQKTITVMVKLYCRVHHNNKSIPCIACQKLIDYAHKRLSNCPFQENKTTCGNCPIHCYAPQLREKVRKVMRYSGPRMIYQHPLMAISHMIDSIRKKPIKTRKMR